MNVSIVGKQFDLTDAIKDHISAAISSLEKYNLDIISARAVVTADERNGKKGATIIKGCSGEGLWNRAQNVFQELFHGR